MLEGEYFETGRMANTIALQYFKPWELRPEEEQTIKRQKDEVEELIRTELAARAAKETEKTGMDRELREPVVGEVQAAKEQKAPDTRATNGPTIQIPEEVKDPEQVPEQQNGHAEMGESHPVEDSRPVSGEQEADVSTPKPEKPKAEESHSEPEQPVEAQEQPKASDKHARHDSGDGELVRGQGGEDDVIY